MQTLAEVEAVVATFSAVQLAELERFVRKTLDGKALPPKPSVRDSKPAHVGKLLRPIGSREEWYDEMLEKRV